MGLRPGQLSFRRGVLQHTAFDYGECELVRSLVGNIHRGDLPEGMGRGYGCDDNTRDPDWQGSANHLNRSNVFAESGDYGPERNIDGDRYAVRRDRIDHVRGWGQHDWVGDSEWRCRDVGGVQLHRGHAFADGGLRGQPFLCFELRDQ